MNIKDFIRNFGARTAGIIMILITLLIIQCILFSQHLLPAWLFGLFGGGTVIFVILNIFDRKDQLRKKGKTLIDKGDELYRKGEIKGAMRDYNRSLEMKGPSWGAYLGLGHCYRVLQDYKKALEYAKKSLECKDDSAAALYLMGICLFRQDYPDSAIKHFEKALKINPELTDSYMMMGEVYDKLGHKDEALKNYKMFLPTCKEPKTIKTIKEKIAKLSS